jgi:hypothetical protein
MKHSVIPEKPDFPVLPLIWLVSDAILSTKWDEADQ